MIVPIVWTFLRRLGQSGRSGRSYGNQALGSKVIFWGQKLWDKTLYEEEENLLVGITLLRQDVLVAEVIIDCIIVHAFKIATEQRIEWKTQIFPWVRSSLFRFCCHSDEGTSKTNYRHLLLVFQTISGSYLKQNNSDLVFQTRTIFLKWVSSWLVTWPKC